MTTLRLVGSNVVHVKPCQDAPADERIADTRARIARIQRKRVAQVIARQVAEARREVPDVIARKAA